MTKLLFEFFTLLRRPYRSVEHLNPLRLSKLKTLVAHSKKNVRFYRLRYSDVRPDKIRTIPDIKQLPITKPTDLRNQPIEDITAENIKTQLLNLQSTSGTSGMPFRFYNSNREIILRQLRMLRFLYFYGWRPWWKGVNIWRETPNSPKSFFQTLIDNKRTHISINLPLQDQAEQILSIQPQFIYGMKDSLEVLADWIVDNFVEYPKAELILTTGAAPDQITSQKIQGAFGHPGMDMYATVETGFVAGQCPHCGHKYFDDDSFIIEILNNKNQPVLPGETGKVVITALDQFSTPIIRYEIGDYITLLPNRVKCKNCFTHYASLDGREADKLTLPTGRTIHYQHLATINKIEGIKQFQLVQKKNADLVFRYVPNPNSRDEDIQKMVLHQMQPIGLLNLVFEKCRFIPIEDTGKFKRLKKE